MANLRPQVDIRLISVVLGYLVVAGLATYPAVTFGGRGIPGYLEFGDEGVFYWNFWMVRRWLWEGQPLWFSHIGYGPWGLHYFTNTHLFTYTLIGALLAPMLSIEAAYNLTTLGSMAAAGLTAYLLARDLRLSRAGAFAAGLVFAFSAVRLAHFAGHPNLITIEAFPLGAMFARRLILARGRRAGRHCAYLALGVIYTAYCSYYTALYYVLATLAALAITAAQTPARGAATLRQRRFWLAALIGVAVSIAALWPIIATWRAVADHWRWQPQASIIPGIDLASLFLPPHPLWLWDWVARPGLVDARNFGVESEAYLGIAATLLVLAAAWSRRSTGWRRRLFRTQAFLFFVLLLIAMGSHPRFWGEEGTLLLPYHFLRDLPLIKNWRAPGRFMLLAALPWGIMAGLGVDALGRALRRSAPSRYLADVRVGLLLGGAFVVFLLETALHLTMAQYRGLDKFPYEILARIRASSKDGVVAVFPMHGHPALSNVLQTMHEKPTLTPFLSRADAFANFQIRGRQSGFIRHRHLFLLPGEAPLPDHDGLAPAEELRRALLAFNVRWIIFQPSDRQEAIIHYVTDRVPIEWLAREGPAPGDLGWAAVEIGQLGSPDEIVLAHDTWRMAPADANSAIGFGNYWDCIEGTSAPFFVWLDAEQASGRRDVYLRVEGDSLPPRLSDRQHQVVSVRFNDEILPGGTRGLSGDREEFSLYVSPKSIKPGWNWIELRFLHELRPVDCIPDSKDERILSFYLNDMRLRFVDRPVDARLEE